MNWWRLQGYVYLENQVLGTMVRRSCVTKNPRTSSRGTDMISTLIMLITETLINHCDHRVKNSAISKAFSFKGMTALSNVAYMLTLPKCTVATRIVVQTCGTFRAYHCLYRYRDAIAKSQEAHRPSVMITFSGIHRYIVTTSGWRLPGSEIVLPTNRQIRLQADRCHLAMAGYPKMATTGLCVKIGLLVVPIMLTALTLIHNARHSASMIVVGDMFLS